MNVLEIDLFFFYQLQDKLDSFINQKHKITYKKTFFPRLLAFIVEIGEFSNETRCFKYWSLNKRMSRSKILEEYIDGIHFLLSLGIPLKFNKKKKLKIYGPKKRNLIRQILLVYQESIKLVDHYNVNQYFKILKCYFKLIFFLNFSLNEIIEVYLKKNKINYERQKNDY